VQTGIQISYFFFFFFFRHPGVGRDPGVCFVIPTPSASLGINSTEESLSFSFESTFTFLFFSKKEKLNKRKKALTVENQGQKFQLFAKPTNVASLLVLAFNAHSLKFCHYIFKCSQGGQNSSYANYKN
jgi:hypothetical protein